jgi:hypothetical protein
MGKGKGKVLVIGSKDEETVLERLAANNNDDIFTIQNQYQGYLEQVGLSEETMKPIQSKQTKRAFMAGFGRSLLTLRNDVSMLPPGEQMDMMQNLHQQTQDFWAEENSKELDRRKNG